MNIMLCTSDTAEKKYCEEKFAAIGKRNAMQISITAKETVKQALFDEEGLEGADLLYFGIGQPEMDGMELAKQLRSRGISADIVFYTRDEGRVFEAFDVDALHYLVPDRTTDAKFEEVFLKAADRYKRRARESIVLSCAGERRKIALSDIYYFEVNKRIITVHYKDGVFEFYSTMSRVEETLFGKGFVRVHRAFLVSRGCIVKSTQTEVTLVNGETIPVGERYSDNLRA